VEQTARFVITGETRTLREGKIEIPLLGLLKAERETGGVAVEVLGAGEIKDFKDPGLESADATDLARWYRAVNRLRWRLSVALRRCQDKIAHRECGAIHAASGC